MKNKQAKTADYFQLKTKMLLRLALMAGIIFISIWAGYTFILRRRFGDWIVSFFQFALRMDYDASMNLYTQIFRNNLSTIFFIFIAIVFCVMLLFFLKWFTRYINEINRGIDELIRENDEDIMLLPELSDTERKLNTVLQTLQKRKIDAQLAEKRKNDLIVYLAHDLKTPLTSVIGYLTLLRDENQISDELRLKYLSISLSKAERLEDLVNEFFEITRFNLSGITLELSRVNLTRMLEQIIFEFQPMLTENNLQCNLTCPHDIMIKCDANKMQRVFDNLLRNAVNYSFEESTVEIIVTASNEVLTISFINQGNTISSEKIDRIFEQFYRLDTARTTKSGGAGLGLAIAKEITELHGGSICASSADELITFTVTIPLL